MNKLKHLFLKTALQGLSGRMRSESFFMLLIKNMRKRY